MEDTAQSKMSMVLEAYGVKLNSLELADLELVRKWRNDPKIYLNMNYRDTISSEMQQKWFNSINNKNNYYFLIECENKKIGLANLKNINYLESCMEGGLFIYDDNYLGTLVPFQIVFCLYDFGFFDLNINMSVAHILKSNLNAIKFNKALGYELDYEQEMIENQRYCLTNGKYLLNRNNILKKLSKHINNK